MHIHFKDYLFEFFIFLKGYVKFYKNQDEMFANLEATIQVNP